MTDHIDTALLPARELIVVSRADADLRSAAPWTGGPTTAEAGKIVEPLARFGAFIEPLFPAHPGRVQSLPSVAVEAHRSALASFHIVRAADHDLDDLAGALRGQSGIAAAYVKPRPDLPIYREIEPGPELHKIDAKRDDYTARQGYLGPAPGGVDARYGWTLPGGSGASVRVMDVECAWRFSHEDLLSNQGGLVGGLPLNDRRWRNHGTAVIGVISGDRNAFGVTGIAPDAQISAVSIVDNNWQYSTARAIHSAADRLAPGDIILIELHRPGPRYAFQELPHSQLGFIAEEWWPDTHAAIRYATSLGIIVVEAAGNGIENFDDAIYDTPPAGFPGWWRNPFRRGPADSGAILVGAGAPPGGTFGSDRSRLDFSNYGSAVDCQGWGEAVTTTGYGDLLRGPNEDTWYTAGFNGTSSASPVVVGTLAALQGIAKNRGKLLRPDAVRNVLRTTGSPQQDGPTAPVTQRIGTRPDLRQLVTAIDSIA